MEVYLNRLFIGILNMSITAGYCIAAVLALRLIFCRLPKKYLYALWLVVAFRLICPVSVSTEFSLFNLDNFSGSTPAEHSAGMEYIPWQTSTEKAKIRTGMPAVDTLINEQAPRAAEVRFRGISLKNLLYVNGEYREPVQAALLAGKYIWLAGMFGMLAYFATGIRKTRRKVRMAVRTEEDRDVYECDDLASPFTMGIFRSRIYLPCYLDEKAKELVLLHERSHIRRGDHVIKPLSFCLLSVYWFHPLVWAAWLCMCRDMEMSCDEKALEILGEERKQEYGRTLLAFASGRFPGNRMSLAFGEHDVKGRIRHALRFRRPALWVGIPAVVLIGAALLVFGTNGVKRGEAEENPGQEQTELTEAQLLYQAKNPYVGDAPANGRLLGEIASARPDSLFAGLSYKTELQTSEEPYEFHFLLEQDGEKLRVSEAEESNLDAEMRSVSALMLALTENLGQVHWHYILDTPDGDSVDIDALCDTEQAVGWCGVEDVKAYGDSPDKVQELLDILERRAEEKDTPGKAAEAYRAASGGGTDDSGEFLSRYAELPYELYEQAVPYENTEESYGAYYEQGRDFMVVLARTDDDIVTVYGYYSREYGSRGITVDYRITPGGDSNHNYMDIVWNADNPCVQAALGDYDRDGSEEIALTLLGGSGTGVHKERLIVFETYETGTLQPCELTEEALRAELKASVGYALDTENNLLQILDGTRPEVSAPLYSVPCEDKEILDVDFLSWYGFELEDGISMWTEPGVTAQNYPGLLYPRLPDRSHVLLSFRVVFDYSESLQSGYFTLLPAD